MTKQVETVSSGTPLKEAARTTDDDVDGQTIKDFSQPYMTER